MKNTNDMILANSIKNLRETQNMSKAELARKLGYKDRSMITKIENGERKVSVEKLQEIADLFKVSAEYLIDNKHTQSRINTMFITPPPKVEIEEDVKAKIDVIIAVYEQCFGVLTNEKKSILNYMIFSFYDAQKL